MDVPTDGSYTLAIRKTDDKNQNMQWFSESKDLKKGTFEYSYENKTGFEIFNTIALIPSADMNVAKQLTQNFLGYFQHFDLQDQSGQIKIQKILEKDRWEYFDINNITKAGWIIYTDSFNESWELENGNNEKSLPMYSMINGFYIDSSFHDFKIVFKGDEDFKWGVYISVLSLLVIIIFILWKKSKND